MSLGIVDEFLCVTKLILLVFFKSLAYFVVKFDIHNFEVKDALLF